MRVAIITGGRDQSPDEADKTQLLNAIMFYSITHVLHGACKGVDMWAHTALKAAGVRVMAVPALWDAEGPSAGPKRNAAMLDIARWMTDGACWEPAAKPVCIAFPGGKGTEGMKVLAKGAGLEMVEIGGDA